MCAAPERRPRDITHPCGEAPLLEVRNVDYIAQNQPGLDMDCSREECGRVGSDGLFYTV